ncbi:MAG: hypothetical protein JXB33_05035 [Clostridia bacterium]|nr:hypothetical protein [Clostridia bacterium]
MDLLERYLYAVGRWLPGKQKEDIKEELRSSILDALEERFGKAAEYDDEQISEVLKELGSPWKVASGYSNFGEQLIGPELMPLYYTITAVISGAVLLGLLVSFIVGLFNPDMSFRMFILGFLKLIPSLITAVATVVGFSTIVFALIDKNVPGYRVKSQIAAKTSPPGSRTTRDSWSPKDLPAVPRDKQKVSLWEPIAGICFAFIAIILFNSFSENLGIYYVPSWGSQWNFVPIFSEDALRTFLPFWNTVWAVSIIFNIFLIIKSRWTLSLRIFDIFRSFLDIAVLSIMIKGPELIDIRRLVSSAGPDVSEALTPVAEIFNYSIDLVLIFALIATVLGMLGKIVKLFRSDTYKSTDTKTGNSSRV